MNLEIITPEQIYFSGKIESVVLPGILGEFTILQNHAPLISALSKGSIVYRLLDGNASRVNIEGGFAEINNNKVVICVEGIS